ncbi:hypothetical protein [Kitasatospora sp. NPDC002040]
MLVFEDLLVMVTLTDGHFNTLSTEQSLSCTAPSLPAAGAG